MLRLFILRIFESYFRHRWLYLLPLVIMVAGAIAYFFISKPTYIARGILYIQNESLLSTLTDLGESTGTFWVSPAQTISSEISELLQTDAFIRAIVQSTDLEDAMSEGRSGVKTVIEEVREDVWVEPIGNNQLVVSASYEDPVIAYQYVEATIENYLNWKTNIQRTEAEAAQEFFKNLIVQYEAELEDAQLEMRQYLEEYPEPIVGERSGIEQLEIDRIQAGIDLAATRYAKALDRQEDTQLALTKVESDVRQTYLLIDAPNIPEEPEYSLKKIVFNMGAFVAAGVFLSAAAIFGGVILDRSFRFPIDVTQRLELPVLAMIPGEKPVSEPRKFSLKFPKITLPNRKKSDLVEPETDEEDIHSSGEVDLAEPV
jgi:uncharacterized protein involved in exopolysaccharide biosynthesis